MLDIYTQIAIYGRACKNWPSEYVNFLSLLYHYLHYHHKIFITTAEFDGLSSAAYGDGILHSKWKTLVKISLGVIYVRMVDVHRPSHI